ncbi:MAG: tetratricopeptide repeat protein [Tannerella sp.]|jgi:tetratricopeptide (TPR) repeat protein|nr:tetratricopeptide repeat protein [Tannerella sp.]
MGTKEIHLAYTGITDALDGGELKTAFERIQNLIFGVQLLSWQNRLNELQNTYRYLLHYYAEGSRDPAREQIYADIRTGAYELTDRIRHQAQSSDTGMRQFRSWMFLNLHPVEVADLVKRLPSQYEKDEPACFETLTEQLFENVWKTDFLSGDDTASLRRALTDERYPATARCQIVSALLLGLQISFDREKLNLLFDAAAAEDMEVRIRALIAVCLTLYRYRQRTMYYPGIRHRLDTLAEAPDFGRIMQTIILRFILSRETEKVTHKIQEEILPEMMKLKFTSKGERFGMLSDFSGDEMNPEWKDLAADNNVTKKLEEYARLQEEGLDVLHSTFIHLKNFGFFSELSNWFLPFTLRHSCFGTGEISGNVGLETLLQASFVCNSDKYSLFLSLHRLPETHRKQMMQQMDGQLSAMNKQQLQELKSRHNQVESITSQYIQDLYRFYKLFPRHTEFEDVFNWTLDFHLLPALQPYLSGAETMLDIAGAYLRKGYYTDAQTLYDQLIEREAQDEMLYQKAGYCRQMTGDWEGALASYLRSELLNPDSPWLLRRLGDCCRLLKRPEEALAFYRRYERLSPDTVSVLICMGHCCLEMKNRTEALKYYFKADYLQPETPKIWRAIAWSSFLNGTCDQALHYYGKLLKHQPQMPDFLNAGHTEWALQHIQNALTCYRSAVQAEDGGFDRFHAQFRQDIPDLVHAGIDPAEIPMLLDQLRYLLQEENSIY